MKRSALLYAFLLIALAGSPVYAQLDSYDDVILIVNESSWSSVEIGEYFASRRGIPEHHICRISADSSESIDSAGFLQLKWQIQTWMRSRNLVDSINYIVTTKGCPLRVTASGDLFDNGQLVALGGRASFEDCLALMNGADSIVALSTRTGFYVSRYFNSNKRFKRDPTTLPMYLVTRLDAYTVAQVKGYILKAENPVILGEGLWVLDVDPGKDGSPGYKIGNDWLRGANRALSGKRMEVLFDTTNTYIHNQQNVVGYGSWGSNDGNSGGGEAAKPGNSWVNGAIAETFVSTGGRSFNVGAGYGQSLVADWIAEGVSGVKGYTDEPYLTSIAHPDIVFDRYTSGFNMAESFYAGSQFIAWRQVTIGDPKMRLGRLLASAPEIDLGSGERFVPLYDTIWVRNTSSGTVEIVGLATGGGDSTDFIATPLDGPLPYFLAGGDSAAVAITFRPRFYRRETTQLLVEHRRSGETRNFRIPLELAGTGLRPVLAAPGQIDFGTADDRTPITQTIRLTNQTESDTVTVNSMTLIGNDKTRFVRDSSIVLPHKILGGESWEFTVTYRPNGIADHQATLNILSTARVSSKAVRLLGRSNTSGVKDLPTLTAVPESILSLSPNPSSGTAVIGYRTSSATSSVRVELLDLLGRPMRVFHVEGVASGDHTLQLDGTGLASGNYLCRLIVESAGERKTEARLLLLER